MGWACINLKEDGHEGLDGVEALLGICFLQLQWQHPGERYYGHWESPDPQRGLIPAAQGCRIQWYKNLISEGKEPQGKYMLSQKARVFTCALPSGPGSLFQPRADFSHSLLHLHTELPVPSSGANIPAVPFGKLPVLSPGLLETQGTHNTPVLLSKYLFIWINL